MPNNLGQQYGDLESNTCRPMTVLGIHFHLYSLLQVHYVVYNIKEDNNAACSNATWLIIPFPLNIQNSVLFHIQNIEVTNQNNSMLIKMTNSVLKARGSPYLKTKSSKEVAIVFKYFFLDLLFSYGSIRTRAAIPKLQTVCNRNDLTPLMFFHL